MTLPSLKEGTRLELKIENIGRAQEEMTGQGGENIHVQAVQNLEKELVTRIEEAEIKSLVTAEDLENVGETRNLSIEEILHQVRAQTVTLLNPKIQVLQKPKNLNLIGPLLVTKA